MKQRIELYKSERGNLLETWDVSTVGTFSHAACESCLEELFVIPKSCTKITLVLSDKRFNNSYEVVISSDANYMIEGFKKEGYALLNLRNKIDPAFRPNNNLNRIFIGVEF